MTAPLEATSVTVTIRRPAGDVYEYVHDLSHLPDWSFFQSAVETDDGWEVGIRDGVATLRLAERNEYGVLDHHVSTDDGSQIYVPLRVVPNGEGSTLMLTVTRQPGMSDSVFAADVAQVETDLFRLKQLLEENR